MSDIQERNISKLKPTRVLIPMILGIGIIGWFLYRDFNKIDFSLFSFNTAAILFIFAAVLMIFFRDFGYVLRMRILSSNELSWKQCIKIVFLWEFGSAITPSAIGGTALATIFLWKEGLNVGKSTSIVLSTSFLDELYFSLMFPLIFIIFSKTQLFGTVEQSNFYGRLFYFALIGYSAKLLWTILVGYSLFLNPRFFANIVKGIFKLRLLRKWKVGADQMAVDFEIANKELKSKTIYFWAKSFLATFISWTSRYWVLNFLLLAMVFSLGAKDYGISIYEHFLIFARQLIMWIMMLVMPSPGGSGFVETVFTTYMSDFVPVAGFTVIIAIIWRLLTYYTYLFIGAIITPGWLNKNFKKAKIIKKR